MNGIKLCGTGAAAPVKVVTNDDMAAMVETSDEWIRTRTGIQERRIAAPDQATSDMAYIAGSRALEMAEKNIKDMDGRIVPFKGKFIAALFGSDSRADCNAFARSYKDIYPDLWIYEVK